MSNENPTGPGKQMGDADLHEVERKYISEPYKEYFLAKRQNFFATLQAFKDLWDCFMLLDNVWMREFSDLERVTDTRAMVPLNLFANAHAQFRTAIELGFSTRIGDAWNLLRSAIESAVYAAKIWREPDLAIVWAAKEDGKQEFEAFRDAFERDKKESIFPAKHGLERLHQHYSSFSEEGTHTSVSAIGLRHTAEHGPHDLNWRLEYFESDPQRLAIFLFSLLDASAEMEQALFNCFDVRLKLDPELANMRAEFANRKSAAAKQIRKQFNLAPPAIWRD